MPPTQLPPTQMPGAPTPTVRKLERSEDASFAELARLAFGGPRPKPDADPAPPRPGRVHYGAFEDERLVAAAADRIQTHSFGGQRVSASGLASVAVAPADRGKGHARALLTELFAGAHARGAAITTLFPTAPALYRGLGCEQVGMLTHYDLPTEALARVRIPAGWTLRAAEKADAATIAAIYAQVAAQGSGLVDRVGPLYEGALSELDGVTLAVSPEGAVEGYLGWFRGNGYDATGRLAVTDLIALNAQATRTLLASLGSWSAVTPTVTLTLGPGDPVFWELPAGILTVRSLEPWMLRLLDVQAAVAERGWPANIEVSLDLSIDDEVCPWNAGPWRLEVADGHGQLTPDGSGGVRIGARGLAVAFAGGVTSSYLHRGGLLEHLPPDAARMLDQLMAGPAPTLLDYF
jgi:predicted acetyltransferase